MTAGEASQLAAATYGAGEEQTTDGGGKLCLYGAQTTNVFEVFVGVASSAATAASEWDQQKARVEASLNKAVTEPGVTVTVNVSDTSISGADRAAAGTFTTTISGHAINGSAVYLLKGAVFCAIVDLTLDHPAPTMPAMENEARTALPRLP